MDRGSGASGSGSGPGSGSGSGAGDGAVRGGPVTEGSRQAAWAGFSRSMEMDLGVPLTLRVKAFGPRPSTANGPS